MTPARTRDSGFLAVGVALVLLGAAVAFLAVVQVLPRPRQALAAVQPPPPLSASPELFRRFEARLQARLHLRETDRPLPPPAQRASLLPRFHLVIDDVGYNLESLRKLLRTGPGLTVSILPNAPLRDEAARRALAAGAAVFLHMPMEAHDASKNHEDPMLLTDMTAQEIEARLSEALGRVPGAIGVSNHMGSRFTEDATKLEIVARLLHERRLAFLDSVTSPRSLAYQVASRAGLHAAARDLFLDADGTPEGVRKAWHAALATAHDQGHIVAIYHPTARTLETLVSLIEASRREVVFTTLPDGAS